MTPEEKDKLRKLRIKQQYEKRNKESTWHKIETNPGDKLYRDCMVKRARAKKFRTKCGITEEGKWFVRILCTPEKLQEIFVESNSLKEKVLAGEVDIYAKPPEKPEEVLKIEQYNTKLQAAVSKFKEGIETYNKTSNTEEKDFYALNKSAKNLYECILDSVIKEQYTIELIYEDGTERFIRCLGKRFNMTEFMASGVRNPNSFSWSKINLLGIKQVKCR